jgi:hypothetical protein
MVCKYATKLSFSSWDNWSAKEGIPPPPVLMTPTTFPSFTSLPFLNLLCWKRPLSEGPSFLSSVSALWQTAQRSNTSLPFSASPLLPAVSGRANAITIVVGFIKFLRTFTPPILISASGHETRSLERRV